MSQGGNENRPDSDLNTLSLSLSSRLSLFLTVVHSHSHTLYLTLTHYLALSHSFTLTHSHTLTYSHSLTIPHTLTLFSQSHNLKHSLSLSPLLHTPSFLSPLRFLSVFRLPKRRLLSIFDMSLIRVRAGLLYLVQALRRLARAASARLEPIRQGQVS